MPIRYLRRMPNHQGSRCYICPRVVVKGVQPAARVDPVPPGQPSGTAPSSASAETGAIPPLREGKTTDEAFLQRLAYDRYPSQTALPFGLELRRLRCVRNLMIKEFAQQVEDKKLPYWSKVETGRISSDIVNLATLARSNLFTAGELMGLRLLQQLESGTERRIVTSDRDQPLLAQWVLEYAPYSASVFCLVPQPSAWEFLLVRGLTLRQHSVDARTEIFGTILRAAGNAHRVLVPVLSSDSARQAPGQETHSAMEEMARAGVTIEDHPSILQRCQHISPTLVLDHIVALSWLGRELVAVFHPRAVQELRDLITGSSH